MRFFLKVLAYLLHASASAVINIKFMAEFVGIPVAPLNYLPRKWWENHWNFFMAEFVAIPVAPLNSLPRKWWDNHWNFASRCSTSADHDIGTSCPASTTLDFNLPLSGVDECDGSIEKQEPRTMIAKPSDFLSLMSGGRWREIAQDSCYPK